MKTTITRILLIALCSYVGLLIILVVGCCPGEFHKYRFMSCYDGLFILFFMYFIYSIVWGGIFKNAWYNLRIVLIFMIFTVIDSAAGWCLMNPNAFFHGHYYVGSWEWFLCDWDTRVYPVLVISAFHAFFYFFRFYLVKIDRCNFKTFEIRQNIKLGLRKLHTVPGGFFRYFLSIIGIVLYNYMVATAFFVQWGQVWLRE